MRPFRRETLGEGHSEAERKARERLEGFGLTEMQVRKFVEFEVRRRKGVTMNDGTRKKRKNLVYEAAMKMRREKLYVGKGAFKKPIQ
jgi:hypothetical protein